MVEGCFFISLKVKTGDVFIGVLDFSTYVQDKRAWVRSATPISGSRTYSYIKSHNKKIIISHLHLFGWLSFIWSRFLKLPLRSKDSTIFWNTVSWFCACYVEVAALLKLRNYNILRAQDDLQKVEDLDWAWRIPAIFSLKNVSKLWPIFNILILNIWFQQAASHPSFLDPFGSGCVEEGQRYSSHLRL